MSAKRLEITGVLLVGGESRRMGKNKALLEIGGKSLIEKNLQVLESVCKQVLISSREKDLYTKFGYEVITDLIKGKGPLVGIFSALHQADYEHVFIAACDMPFLNQNAIRFLYEKLEDYDAVVPYAKERLHPLHSVYQKRILPIIEEHIRKDRLKMIDLLDSTKTKILRLEAQTIGLADKETLEQSLLNINTPEEWKAMVEKKVE